MLQYKDYQHLLFDWRPHGVLVITMNRPASLNAFHTRLHHEMAEIWLTIDADPRVRVAIITGAGRAFSVGGDKGMMEEMASSPDFLRHALKEAAGIVYNMINCEKPIISAINGVAIGAGCAVALMADISIMADEVNLMDGHSKLGVVAGDHAALIWPLLCGMAKSKYYLLTSDFINGKEAERIGLVSVSVPAVQLLSHALEVAHKLACGPQQALRWTKRSLNQWLRMAGPIFEQSLALEMLSFSTQDAQDGVKAVREKRPVVFTASL